MRGSTDQLHGSSLVRGFLPGGRTKEAGKGTEIDTLTYFLTRRGSTATRERMAKCTTAA